MATTTSPPLLKFTSHRALTRRLVLATLTGRAIRISQIRSSSPTHPGLAPHEVSFLRLLDAITNGSQIEFSYTGTTVVYRPGLITGSAAGYGATQDGVLRHEIPATCHRGLSWYLVPLCQLAPFAKGPVNVLFTGPGVITSATGKGDIAVDTVRTAVLPLYAQFGIQNNIELRIIRRSAATGPGAGSAGVGGEVQLVFGHQVRLPTTLHWMNPGRIKRIRGVAYAVGVSGANNARTIESARGILNPFVADTYVFSDVSSAPPPVQKGASTGPRKKCVGFGISLVAESTTGALFSADLASPPEGGVPPEEIGKQCAYQLLESVAMGGCVSSIAAPTALILMAMGSEDVGRLQLGRDVLGSEEIVELARDLRTFGASGWGLRDANQEKGEIVVSVVGRGVGNVGRKIA